MISRPLCYERVVSIALPFYLRLILVLGRKAVLHLYEAFVVELCGVDVAAGKFGIGLLRYCHAKVYARARVVGVIETSEYLLVHS